MGYLSEVEVMRFWQESVAGTGVVSSVEQGGGCGRSRGRSGDRSNGQRPICIMSFVGVSEVLDYKDRGAPMTATPIQLTPNAQPPSQQEPLMMRLAQYHAVPRRSPLK